VRTEYSVVKTQSRVDSANWPMKAKFTAPIGSPARSSGLASMRRRAENNGGTLQITAPASGGTRLTWTPRLRQGAGAARVPGSSCMNGTTPAD
jgi:hypothetical protein